MDPAKTSQPQNTNPTVSNEELKMPEEQFGEEESVPERSGLLVPILIAVLVLLLGVLGALFFWGDALLNMLNTAEDEAAVPPVFETSTTTNDTANTPQQETPTTTEEALAAIEAELSATDYSEFEAELQAIDDELASESTTTTAQ